VDTLREERRRGAVERSFCFLSVATLLFSDMLVATSVGLSTYYRVHSTSSVRTSALDVRRRDVPRFITLNQLQRFRHIHCNGVDELDIQYSGSVMEVGL
jgi:hypothetical protein